MKRTLAQISCLLLAVTVTSLGYCDESDTPDVAKESTWVTSIAPLGGSNQFVAATANGLLLREADVVSFEAANIQELKTLYTHPAAVWCVDATTDGSKIVSVDYRGNLGVFDVASGKPTIHEKALERWCQAMLLTPDDKNVVAGNEAGKVMVWDLDANKVTKSVELDGHAVTGLAFSPDGSQIAASDGDGHVHLLAWPGLEASGKIEVCENTAWCVAYADANHLLVGSGDRNLYRCEAKAEAKAESIAKGSDWITQLAVSPGGQVAAAEVGGKLHFPTTGGTDSMQAKSGVWSLCWNGDGQLLAGTRKDGLVAAGRSWKWADTQPKAAPEKPAEKAEEKPAEKPEAAKPEEKKADAEKPAEPKAEAEPAAPAENADAPKTEAPKTDTPKADADSPAKDSAEQKKD